jgi:hypothetical protein
MALSSAIIFSGSENNYLLPLPAIGDVNGDGYGDILINIYEFYENGTQAYNTTNLMLGSSSPYSMTLSNAIIFTDSGNELVGNSFAIGDVNGDGLGDMLIEAYNTYNRDIKAYLVLGNKTPGLNGKNNCTVYSQEMPYRALNPDVQIDYTTEILNATIAITNNYQPAEDNLKAVNLTEGITALPFNTTSGTLILTGLAPAADYQAALQQVVYFNNASNPNTSSRTISFQVNNGRLCGVSTPFEQSLLIEIPSPSATMTPTVIATLSRTKSSRLSPSASKSLTSSATLSPSPSASLSPSAICTYTCYPRPSSSASGSYYPIPPSSTPTPTLTPSRTLPITPTATPPENSSSPLAPAMLALAVSAPVGGFFLFIFFCFCFYYRKRKENRYAGLNFDDNEGFDDEDIEVYPLADLSSQASRENTLPVPGDISFEELRKINSPQDWCSQGVRHLNKAHREPERYQQAKACFEAAVSLGSSEALYQLGNLYLEQPLDTSLSKIEQMEQALTYYQRAGEQNHQEASYAAVRTQYELALLYLEEGRLQAAYFQLEAAIENGYLAAQEKLKEILKDNLHLPISHEIAQQMKSHDYGLLAKAAEEENNLTLAREQLNKALELDSFNRTLLHVAALYKCRQIVVKLLDEDSTHLEATDQAGKTPLDIALQQQDAYCAGALQQEAQFRAVQRKNEEKFQAHIANLRLQAESEIDVDESMLLQEETEELYRRIAVATDEDTLAAAKADLSAYTKTLNPLTQNEDIQHLSRLIKRLTTPNQVLRCAVQKNQGLLTSHLLVEVERQLLRKVNLIDAAIDSLSRESVDAINLTLNQIRAYYHDIVAAIESAPTFKDKLQQFAYKVKLHSAALPHRYLTADAAKHLVVEESPEQRENQYGIHVVRGYQGVHYKINPHAPGVEYMVNSLAQILSGRVTPPTALLKVKDLQHSHVYLASKTVVGINLEHILLNHLELIPKINQRNFAELFFLGVLVKPRDAKADNHMTKIILDRAGEIKELKIISIDNDIAFADNIIKEQYGPYANKHYVSVKNVLYFLPQMDDPIEESYCRDFLSLSPEVLSVLWLESLARKNEEYAALVEAKVLDESQLKALKLPIKLVPGLALQLY